MLAFDPANCAPRVPLIRGWIGVARSHSDDMQGSQVGFGGADNAVLSPRTFARVRTLIRDLAGIALDDSKEPMVCSRLARLAREEGLPSLESLLDLAEAGGRHQQAFINALTTNLTSFFREPHHFPLLADFLRDTHKSVSIWCAAASSGEEPYSIAITALDALGKRATHVRVLATDIDTDVLARASAGVYRAEQLRDLDAAKVRRYFLKGTGSNEGLFRVGPEVQAMVRFAPLNLLAPAWPDGARHDVIFCRNVMIYFDRATQAAVLQRLLQSLDTDGLLFAGHSEHLHLWTPGLVSRGRTVYAKGGNAAARVRE